MKKFFNCCLLLPAVLLAGCSTANSITWLQDLEYGERYPVEEAPELILQPLDRLQIHVLSTNSQLVEPFTIYASGSTEDVSPAGSSGYTIDSAGNIEFPVLGTIHASGKTISEVRSEIASGIQQHGFIKDPIVDIGLDNFVVTVIGIKGEGVLKVPEGRMTLLQALAASKAVDVNSKIRDVMVIRTENGNRTAYSVNLQSKDLFDSPVYYLRQNDMIYVKPQGFHMSASGQISSTFISTILSVATIISNYILWSSR